MNFKRAIELKTFEDARDQALASLIFAAAISLAVLLSVFGPQKDLEVARQGLALHENLYANAKDNLAQNQNELESTKAAFDRMK